MNLFITTPILAQAAPPPPVTAWAANTILVAVALGFFLGAVGQAARVIVGLKKTADEARAKGSAFSAQFEASQLVVSLIIGGVAGTLASLGVLDTSALLSKQVVLGLMAAGYAGSDFIEGFMRDAGKNLSGAQPAPDAPPRTAKDLKAMTTSDAMAALLRESRPS